VWYTLYENLKTKHYLQKSIPKTVNEQSPPTVINRIEIGFLIIRRSGQNVWPENVFVKPLYGRSDKQILVFFLFAIGSAKRFTRES